MSSPCADHFSQSYSQARERFLVSSKTVGAKLQSFVQPDTSGAENEELAIDVALLGPADAKQTLILTSGMHGIEGFCGSACQLALLGNSLLLENIKNGKTSVLLIHALNPYGFSF